MSWLLRGAGFLAALLVVAAAGLLVTGMRANAGRVYAAVEVKAPPDSVWPWLNEPDRLKRWVDGLEDVQLDIATPPGVGAKAVWVMRDKNNPGRLIEPLLTPLAQSKLNRDAARLRSALNVGP